ncbi:RimK family protein [Alkalilimnicola sp. S0819]|uniref:RimK family protein n=1 Tax=Alkalilimnicola sp. S0819 TaxID=2613922 RepID=UPI0012618E7F|nr:RimK family protein [Alkalilimnicola sp. S0819]KAB7624398.1 RimK family protein [Alkalilimnicola sp. S0819]MPQ16225.1 RimK family alpha-L-glutamate ligase [Alkalilimnicola sp. S0819]
MGRLLIVVDALKDWRPYYPSENLISVDDYLFGGWRDAPAGTRVINLCRRYKYLSTGYYCSLLAEARRHRVLPSVRTINDLSRKSLYSLNLEGLGNEDLQKPLDKVCGPREQHHTLLVYFGRTERPELAELGRQLFEVFTAPILRVDFRRQEQWRIHAVSTQGFHKLVGQEEDCFAEALDTFSRRIWRRARARRPARYDLAILQNPGEALPPSNTKALKHFIRVGRELGVEVELIEKRHYAQLAEYDALFIRETTAISDHTYRFATRAESEGLVVMDDPQSILRCTNKVYLADLLQTHKLPTPRGRILHRGRPADLAHLEAELGLPLVLKIPDGSFSRGVIKVHSREELPGAAAELFQRSELILAQEYVYTEFDWRIGVLNRRPIFACRYFMSKGHWQIVQHGPDGAFSEGAGEAMAVHEAPPAVVKTAVKAAGLIGDGLYGVDLKQTPKGVYLIEVNDNPNLDAGVEDGYLGDELYRVVLGEFMRRVDLCRGRSR